jgi:hypothetical protein
LLHNNRTIPWWQAFRLEIELFKNFFLDNCHYTDAVICFFPELSASEFQPVQHNATSLQPTAICMWSPNRRRYTDSGRFECPKCLKTYSYSRTLKRHVKFECGKEPQLQCPHCPKRTIHNANLKRHIMIMHSLRWLLSRVCLFVCLFVWMFVIVLILRILMLYVVTWDTETAV